MKIAFSFLFISTLVLISHQQRYTLPQVRNVLPPWSLLPKQPSIQDIYEYLYARSLVESLKSAQPDHRPEIELQDGKNTPQWADAQSRSKSSGSGAEATSSDENPANNARIFLNYVTTAGSSSSYFNPLLKTIYYISSATATTTLVTTCVPALSYTKTLYTVPCKKRREVMGILLAKGHESEAQSEQTVLPSKAQSVEPTVVARAFDLPNLGDDAILVPIEVSSSKTEDYLIERGLLSDVEKLREKRFFIASTTITSYAFVTTTSTKTLSNLGSSLSCLPSQFLLC